MAIIFDIYTTTSTIIIWFGHTNHNIFLSYERKHSVTNLDHFFGLAVNEVHT